MNDYLRFPWIPFSFSIWLQQEDKMHTLVENKFVEMAAKGERKRQTKPKE